jgi:Zn-dependent protease
LSNIALALVAGVMIRAFLVSGYDGVGLSILAVIVYINLLLTVFNLLPIPPLDGSKLLFTFLPISQHTKAMLEQYGFIILFAFIFIFSGVFLALFNFVVKYFSEIVIGASLGSFF